MAATLFIHFLHRQPNILDALPFDDPPATVAAYGLVAGLLDQAEAGLVWLLSGPVKFRNLSSEAWGFATRRLGVVFILASLLVASSCTTAAITPNAPAPPIAAVAIGALIDKTGSAPTFRVPQPGIDAFAPLIDLLRCRGGDLRICTINDHQPDAMIRLQVSPPPSNQPVQPEGTTGNPLRDREAQETYEAEKTKFDAQYKRWQTSVEGDVARFRVQLTRLLSEPATPPRTDISDAIRRADIFLSEPQPPGRPPAHRYLICATDGRDNVHASPVAMSSQARLLIVNSSGSLGSLESLRPLRFESLAAAVDFIQKSEIPEKEEYK